MTKNLCTAVIALMLSACCDEAQEVAPSPEHERLDQCLEWCSEIDDDVLNFPPLQCPGPDDDTSYMRCVGECVARMPNGAWCPPA
jgi:hypothetical protein